MHTEFVPFRETQLETDTIAILLNQIHKPSCFDQLKRKEMIFYYDRVEKITDEHRQVQFERKVPGYTELKQNQLKTIMRICHRWKQTKSVLLLKGTPLPFVLGRLSH
jgi:hypothetical protein